ncbi:GGDEF domain-containing protein [Permianibacter sp. IMCC34836]|uniref:tetratricopeptide repeat-containing diguanylate cyclase n=1 Tax=Permianibacter fluminis TaxID=2738515 RepID=UPI00155381FD|nr:tetratricopeptide repeat-containing diguanylate cyclase [Permianibacter fluminis]NQD35723.1 GGDEF domain-containing protein [Permianibacter fluminis]
MLPRLSARFRPCASALLSVASLLASTALPAADAGLQQRMAEADAARYRSPSESRQLNAKLREQLKNQPDPELEARTYLNDCLSLIEQDGEQGAAAAGTGLKLLSELATPSAHVLTIRLKLCQLQAQEYLGALSESLIGYDKLQREAEMLGDPELDAEIRLVRGELRSYLGQFADGLVDLQTACKIYQEKNDTDEALSCLQAIAILYYRLQDYDRAIEYLNEIIPERERRQQTAMLADAVFNLARSLEGKGNISEALARYDQMMQLSRQLGNNTGVAYAQQAIGALHTKQGEPGKGLVMLDAALTVFRELGDSDMSARLLQYRGDALHQLKRDADAIAALEESIALYQSIDQKPGLEKSYGMLATVLMDAKMFERAGQTLLKQQAVHEQLDKSRRDEMLAQQRAQFDAEKKDQENRYLQNARTLADNALEAAARVDRLKTLVIVLIGLLLTVAAAFLARQMRLAGRLRSLALSDELTGIGNRRSVLTFLEEQIKLHRITGKPLSVALLDIDQFKQLNDRYGHGAGDEALKRVAATCQQLMRGNDKIGRTGGEEFLAVLPDASLAAAGDVARRLCEQIHDLSLDSIAPGLRTSVSIGVSQWHPEDANSTAVISRADKALYMAKSAGRDQVQLLGN